ncbi:hypothetical protein [Chitinophaga sp. CF418]|uniref:hypothetical protein n=1 Tax=Chitinophaga sp. CF418 TaxID=1855287 RepID=UPI00090F7934|nr:hypothetical protein [Chitinophaga sp. CF418]SHN22315.1 hypothetical protein SAMN05216311_10731 [Chitinophaga sp. CF418]
MVVKAVICIPIGAFSIWNFAIVNCNGKVIGKQSIKIEIIQKIKLNDGVKMGLAFFRILMCRNEENKIIYWRPEYVNRAVTKLVDFFGKNF